MLDPCGYGAYETAMLQVIKKKIGTVNRLGSNVKNKCIGLKRTPNRRQSTDLIPPFRTEIKTMKTTSKTSAKKQQNNNNNKN